MPDDDLEEMLKKLGEQVSQETPKKKKPRKKKEKKEDNFDYPNYIPTTPKSSMGNIFESMEWDSAQGKFVPKKKFNLWPLTPTLKSDFSILKTPKPDLSFLDKINLVHKPDYNRLLIDLPKDKTETNDHIILKGRVQVGIEYRTRFPSYNLIKANSRGERLYSEKKKERITLFNIESKKYYYKPYLINPDIAKTMPSLLDDRVRFDDVIKNVAVSKNKAKVAFQLTTKPNEGMNNAEYEGKMGSVYVVNIDGADRTEIEYSKLGIELPPDEDPSRVHHPFVQQASLYEPKWNNEGLLEVKAQLHYAEKYPDYDSDGSKAEKTILASGPPCLLQIRFNHHNKIEEANIVNKLG